MAKVPVQLVVAAYRDEEAADQVADALKQAKQQGQIYYQNVAVVRKNPEGKVKIKETGDMGAAPGAGIGAVAGGALGLLAGPAGLVAGAAVGAVIGGVGAALHDAGIPDDRLEEIGDVLGPGNSAFIGIFDQVKVDKEVMAEVDQSAAEAVEALAADIGSTLQAGQDVAYVFAVTDLSVKLVATNSHSMKPMIFKLSGAWGNHEGSMLLWITVMAIAGGAIALIERRLPEKTMMATLSAQAFVG